MPFLVFFFLCVVWGTTWIAIKISLEGLPPFLGASLRFSLALLLLLSYIVWKRISLHLPRRDFLVIASSAFLMYALDYGLIYWGEQYLSAGVTAIFFATFPLFTGIWATFLFRSERFSRSKFVGLLLALVGVTIVFLDQLISTRFDRQVLWAIVAIIIGAAGGAMSVVLIKKHLPRVNPVALSFHQMLQGVVILYGFSLILEPWNPLHINLRVILAVAYLGAIGSALAFALYYWLLQKWSATTLALIIYITPLVALWVDYLTFGEVIHWQGVVGMVIIFSGISIVQFHLPFQRFLQQKFSRLKH